MNKHDLIPEFVEVLLSLLRVVVIFIARIVATFQRDFMGAIGKDVSHVGSCCLTINNNLMEEDIYWQPNPNIYSPYDECWRKGNFSI